MERDHVANFVCTIRAVTNGDETLIYRYMKLGEETEVSKLVSRVFNQCIAPNYSQEGIQEFESHVDPDLIASRTQADHFVLVAELNGGLVGIIQLRNYSLELADIVYTKGQVP